MSPDEARHLLAELFPDIWNHGGGYDGIYLLYYLAEDNVPSAADVRECAGELEKLVIEGEIPAEAVDALHIAAQDAERRYSECKAWFLDEFESSSVRAVGTAVENEGLLHGVVFDAFADAHEEYGRRKTPAPAPSPLVDRVLVRSPRRRESRPRRRSRSSARSPTRSTDDDLADLHPRCPRCGRPARPLRGGEVWACDWCRRELAILALEVAYKRASRRCDLGEPTT